MWYVLVIFAIILGIVFEKSKLVSTFQLCLMWVMMGWSFGNADYQNYLTRYTYYDSSALEERTEYLFFKLFRLGNNIGLSYEQFLILMSLAYVLALGIIIKKTSSNPNLVYALYFIFPACVETTQIRFSFACAFVLLGFILLFNENIRLGEIYFAVLIIIAALFHIGTILFMIMLPIRRLNLKRTVVYTGACCLVIAIMGMGGANKVLSLFPGMLSKLSYIHTFTFNSIVYWMIIEIIIWTFFLIMLRTFNHFCEHNNLDKLQKKDYIQKVAIISGVVIPVTFFFKDVYRIQQLLCILFYCFVSNIYLNGIIEARGMRKIVFNNTRLIMLVLCVMFALFYLFIVVLSSSNFETVFIPYFENNQFFESVF